MIEEEGKCRAEAEARGLPEDRGVEERTPGGGREGRTTSKVRTKIRQNAMDVNERQDYSPGLSRSRW